MAGIGRVKNTSRPVPTLLVFAGALYAAFLPFDFLPFLGGRSVALPLAAIFLALYLVEFFSGRVKDTVPQGFGLLAVLLLTWAALTVVWSANRAETVLATASLGFHIVLVAGLYSVMRHRKIALLWCYSHGTLVAAVLLLLAAPNAARDERASVGGVDENGIALGIALGFAAACYLAIFVSKGLPRVLALAEMLVMGLAMAHTGSRTGVASVGLVLCAAGLIAILNGRIGARIRAMAATLLIVLCVYYGYHWGIAHGYVPERIVDFVASPEVHDPGRDRIVSQYLRFVDEWSVFGVGYGADVYFLLDRNWGHNNAHSLFWKTWIELGLPGLFLMGTLIFIAIREGVQGGNYRLVLLMWSGYAAFAWSLGGDRTDQFWWMVALSISRSSAEIQRATVIIKSTFAGRGSTADAAGGVAR